MKLISRNLILLFFFMNIMVCVVHAKDICVGLLSDLTGPTSSESTSYAHGVQDAVRYINSSGGINGENIRLLQSDYAYDAHRALSAYEKFVSENKIVALQSWGTQATELLSRFAAHDKIPIFSASYSVELADPTKAPYNFYIAADYTTQFQAALQFLSDHWEKDRPPRLALMYPDIPYGRSPIREGKAYAFLLGFDIVGEEEMSLKSSDSITQLLRLKKVNPDYIWVGGTTVSTSVILRDAKAYNLDTTFLYNIWGWDESLLERLGDIAHGDYSIQTTVVYGQDVPGMKIIEKLTDGAPQQAPYIRGFASMLVMGEAMRQAAESGGVTGQAIKTALERMRDFSPLGLTPVISFYPDDHRPNMSVYLYQIKNGSMSFVGEESLKRPVQKRK